MKAIAVEPTKSGSARLEDIPEPDPHEGSVLVDAIGVLAPGRGHLLRSVSGQSRRRTSQPMAQREIRGGHREAVHEHAVGLGHAG